MQTSKSTILKRLGMALALLGVAIVLDVILSLALQPVGMTEIAWYDYRNRADEPIDTLIVGSSYASHGVDPSALDEQLGSYSFNLATPAQAMHNSAACIRTADDDHHIQRAIICLRTSTLQFEPWYNAQITFLEAKSLGEGPLDVLHNVGDVALYQDNFQNSRSLGWMFPWVYNPLQPLSTQSVAENVSRRLASSDPAADTSHMGKDYVYLERGHSVYDKAMNFRTFDVDGDAFKLPEALPLLDGPTHEFEALLDDCASRGIKTYVILMPVCSMGNLASQSTDYRDLMMSIQEISESHGATYVDFNLAKPDFYRPEECEFIDTMHLNLDGSMRFSKALGTCLHKLENAEDVSPLFYTYDEWDDFIASFAPVEGCYFRSELEPESIALEASAIHQPDASIEYRFEVKEKKKGAKYRVVRDFATSPRFSLPVEGEGTCVVRLTARVAGSTSKKDTRTFHRSITY